MERVTLEHHTLILLMGVAASGKTTIAKGLLKRVGAVYLDNNFVADAFFPNTRSDLEYLDLRPRFYDALYRIVEENLLVGNSVLLDAPHIRQVQTTHWRGLLEGLVKRTGSELAIVRCYCSEATLERRLRDRLEARDIWKLQHWARYLRAEPPLVEIPFEHIDLDTEERIEKNMERAVGYILSVGGVKRG